MKKPQQTYPFQKNDVIEVDIVDFGAEGEGVAKLDGVPLFIPRALKGERIRAKVVAVKSSHAFAVVQQVLKSVPQRVEPPCQYARVCGGCSLQHIAYDTQLEIKSNRILSTMQKTAGISLPLSRVEPSTRPLGCRNKLSLPVRRTADGRTVIGFFRARSHDVVDIEDCMMHAFPCRALIAACKEFMAQHSISPYCETQRTGQLRHLCVRVLQDMASVTLVATEPNPQAFLPFYDAVKTIYGEKATLWYNYHPHHTNVIFGEAFTRLGGSEQFYTMDGLTFPLHPAAFFQVNDAVRKRLFDYVVEQATIATGDVKATAIEAYAGQGILAALLARHFTNVTAVERLDESIQAGECMKEHSNLQNLRFLKGDCKDVLPNVLRTNPPSVLVLDPPRTGLEPTVAQCVAEGAAGSIIYISCNPATLARDCKILSKSYEVTCAAAFDMFPQTPNVETVLTLRKRRPKDQTA